MEQAVTQQTRSAKWEAIWQFIKFGMIGAMNTLINYGVYSKNQKMQHRVYGGRC